MNDRGNWAIRTSFWSKVKKKFIVFAKWSISLNTNQPLTIPFLIHEENKNPFIAKNKKEENWCCEHRQFQLPLTGQFPADTFDDGHLLLFFYSYLYFYIWKRTFSNFILFKIELITIENDFVCYANWLELDLILHL